MAKSVSVGTSKHLQLHNSSTSQSSDLVTPKVLDQSTHPLLSGTERVATTNSNETLSNNTSNHAMEHTMGGVELKLDTSRPSLSPPAPSVDVDKDDREDKESKDHTEQQSVVLVAKRLTNSDASSGRIILPRVAVETNLSFVVAYRHYGMHVRDAWGETHEFVVKSWANGSESRRVFVLEGVGKFLKQHHVGVGDVVGICAVGDVFTVEVNTDEVRVAAASTGRSSAGGTPRGASTPRFSFGRPLLDGNTNNIVPVGEGGLGLKCGRSAKCTKGNGHAGFCSGPKGAGSKRVAELRGFPNQYPTLSGNTNSDYSTMGFYGAEHLDHVQEEEDEFQQATYAETVFVDEVTLNGEMGRLPDGLHRLVYVPNGVKVAKQLTEYDLASRRIVLPADQASRGFLLSSGGDSAYTLAVVDESMGWQFPTIRCWKSVTDRSGYFLEDAGGVLRSRDAKVGDILVIFRDSIRAPPRMLVLNGETCAVKRPVDGPDAEVDFLALPILLLPYGDHGDLVAGGGNTLRDVKRWHRGKMGGCCKSVCCLLGDRHHGGCVFEEEREEAKSRKRGAGEYESSARTPVHGERRSSRFAGGPDPLVSLLNLLE